MTSHKHRGIAYTIRKLDNGSFQAIFKNRRGHMVAVTPKLRRLAVACIKAHIDDELDDE